MKRHRATSLTLITDLIRLTAAAVTLITAVLRGG